MLDPRLLMRQMKMNQINAEKIFIKKDGKIFVINNPEIVEMDFMGQKMTIINNFELKEASEEDLKEICKEEININEDDINFVAEQLNISKEKAKELLIKTKGDIALAIEIGEKEEKQE
jgi:NACalpha-BTF3-like transcription factor